MDGHPAPVIWNIEAVPLPHELLQQVNISCSGCNPHSRAPIVVGLREIHPYVRQTVRDEGGRKKERKETRKKSLLVQNTYIWFAGLFGCCCLVGCWFGFCFVLAEVFVWVVLFFGFGFVFQGEHLFVGFLTTVSSLVFFYTLMFYLVCPFCNIATAF